MLHVFEDLVPAKKFWSKMKNGKLYKVHVDDAELRHKGDMQLTEKLHELAKKNADLKPTADSYWKSELTESPEIELLVNYAIVTEVISSSEGERRAYLERSKTCYGLV